MRSFAYTILIVIFLAILIEPMVEIAIILKEKITLGSAITNSCLVAKSDSLNYEDMRDMDAVIDKPSFMNEFSVNFSEVLDLTCVSITANQCVFKANSNPNKVYTVTIDSIQRVDVMTQKTVTDIDIHAETEYIYKTKYLKEADASIGGIDFMITCDRDYLAIIEN